MFIRYCKNNDDAINEGGVEGGCDKIGSWGTSLKYTDRASIKIRGDNINFIGESWTIKLIVVKKGKKSKG